MAKGYCQFVVDQETGELCGQEVNVEVVEGIDGTKVEMYMCETCDLTDDGRDDLAKYGWMPGTKKDRNKKKKEGDDEG